MGRRADGIVRGARRVAVPDAYLALRRQGRLSSKVLQDFSLPATGDPRTAKTDPKLFPLKRIAFALVVVSAWFGAYACRSDREIIRRGADLERTA